ncbi:PilW family protein [Variovorax paradoxus]|nr:PilW family protein [Variovorax paradoxus]
MTIKHSPGLGPQQGRTLLELLISITIGLVILGALIAIYLSTHSSSRQSAAISRLNEDAGIALNLLGTQLRMAGFSPPRVHMTPGAALVNGVLVSVPDRNFVGAGIRGCDHGFVSHTADDFEKLACAGGTSGAAAFAIRFEGLNPADIDSVQALLPPNEDCLNQEVTTDPMGALGVNYRLVESRFLVRVGPASGTFELSCAGNGGLFAANPVMQFVEDMTVVYGVAEDGLSREVTSYLKAAGIDALPGSVDQRWSRVVTVSVCILMRSAEPDPAGAGSYVDCEGASKPSENGLIRRAYRSVFTLRNRGGFAGSVS